jgi:hypothetical protein
MVHFSCCLYVQIAGCRLRVEKRLIRVSSESVPYRISSLGLQKLGYGTSTGGYRYLCREMWRERLSQAFVAYNRTKRVRMIPVVEV